MQNSPARARNEARQAAVGGEQMMAAVNGSMQTIVDRSLRCAGSSR